MTKKIPGKYDYLKKKGKDTQSNSRSGSSKIFKIFIILLILTIALMFGGYLIDRPNHDFDYEQQTADMWSEQVPSGYDMVLYSDQDCSCCHLYEEYLISYGFQIKSEFPQKLTDIKDYNGIPFDKRSCHTIKFGEYFIEGHIPIDAVEALLDQQPNIDGIALAGMPSGSPGMSGEKNGDFVIYSIKDGQSTGVFMTI